MSRRALNICPLKREEASEYIREHHRHHDPSISDIFRMGIHDGARVCGVATVGRPVARAFDDGRTVEINRVCVEEGIENGASMLLGACRRAAWALGFTRVVTYTLVAEGGSSLRAAGYRIVGERKDRHWNAPGRPRVERRTGQKYLWECVKE